jgi:hypothetical protein
MIEEGIQSLSDVRENEGYSDKPIPSSKITKTKINK